MTASRSPHRRASGAIRKLSSGRYQARYTGPDGLLRTLGTFATKTEADQVLAHETSRMALGAWHDPRLGDEPLGAWFRDWLATRGDLSDPAQGLPGRGYRHHPCRRSATIEYLAVARPTSPRRSCKRPSGGSNSCTYRQGQRERAAFARETAQY